MTRRSATRPRARKGRPEDAHPKRRGEKLHGGCGGRAAVVAACGHVKTGTKAGDCSFTPVREVPAPSPKEWVCPRVPNCPSPQRCG